MLPLTDSFSTHGVPATVHSVVTEQHSGLRDKAVYTSSVNAAFNLTSHHRPRHKRTRTGSGGADCKGAPPDAFGVSARKARRHASVHQPPLYAEETIRNCLLDVSDSSNPSSSTMLLQSSVMAVPEDSLSSAVTVDPGNRLDVLEEDNSLSSSVFCEHQLLTQDPSTTDEVRVVCHSAEESEVAECLTDDEIAHKLNEVSVVTVEVSSVDDDQDGNIATPATTTNNDDAGSTDAEDDGEKVAYSEDINDVDQMPSCISDHQDRLGTPLVAPDSRYVKCGRVSMQAALNSQPSNGGCSHVNTLNGMIPDFVTLSSVHGTPQSMQPPNASLALDDTMLPSCLLKMTTTALDKSAPYTRFSTDKIVIGGPHNNKPFLSSYSSTASLASNCSLGSTDEVNTSDSRPLQFNKALRVPDSHNGNCLVSHPSLVIEESSLQTPPNCSSLATTPTSTVQEFDTSLFYRANEAAPFVETVRGNGPAPADGSCTDNNFITTSSGEVQIMVASSTTPDVCSRKNDLYSGLSGVSAQVSETHSCTTTTNCANQNAQGSSRAKVCVALVDALESDRHVYPLRSRLKRESLRREWRAAQIAPKCLDQLPTELLLRIVHYLSVQELFRIQRVNKRFKSAIDQYLLLVKRLNFSNGLPFAFLSNSLDDAALKRLLSHTPEVTHILGFYPRRINDSYPVGIRYGNSRSSCSGTLTYTGIIEAFRSCSKLRSVELMDVPLMGKLVHYLPRVKFHGMFRNRPDSWDCEYAVPMQTEPTPSAPASTMVTTSPSKSYLPNSDEPGMKPSLLSQRLNPGSLFGCYVSTLFSTVSATNAISTSEIRVGTNAYFSSPTTHPNTPAIQSGATGISLLTPIATKIPTAELASTSTTVSASLAQAAAAFAHRAALKASRLAEWFEPVDETPLGQGAPPTAQHLAPHNAPRLLNIGLGMQANQARAAVQNAPLNVGDQGIPRPQLAPQPPVLEPELFPLLAQGDQGGLAEGIGYLAPMLGANLGDPDPMIALAIAAAAVNNVVAEHPAAAPHLPRRGRPASPPIIVFPPGPGFVSSPHYNRRPELADSTGSSSSQVPPNSARNVSGPGLASPLPSWQWIALPTTIANLTKLDLVSVCINAIPRLDNIKYLHLKWVRFSIEDPFFNFSAPKLQSFVMNNCVGPSLAVKFIRVFSALSRAPQLTRLELVATKFVDGLVLHILEDDASPIRNFRNLQRLVLAGNNKASEMDVGLLLVAGQQSLGHVAMQIAHTRNSLFDALSHAGVHLLRLESLLLGYQDPYQSRLTTSELFSLGLVDSLDGSRPWCSLTDRGLATAFSICPRLINLTLRHAPYISSFARISAQLASTAAEGSLQVEEQVEAQPVAGVAAAAGGFDLGSQAASVAAASLSVPLPPPGYLPLRSLTLENCPGIRVQELERILSTGEPFVNLDSLVLRDMLLPSYAPSPDLASALCGDSTERPRTWSQLWEPDLQPRTSQPSTTSLNTTADWRCLGLLLTLADLLSTRRLAYAPLAPAGVGLGASARDVSITTGIPAQVAAIHPFDVFFTLRMHTYLSSLLQVDGSCGLKSVGQGRVATAILKAGQLFDSPLATAFRRNDWHSLGSPCGSSTEPLSCQEADFVSRATQTCVCGFLEWDVMLRAEAAPALQGVDKPPQVAAMLAGLKAGQSHSVPSTIPPAQFQAHQQQQQLGGPLAFHPFAPSHQHMSLYQFITSSAWSQEVTQSIAFSSLPEGRLVTPISGPNECMACASDPSDWLEVASLHPNKPLAPSLTQPERSLTHHPRTWVARDACVDTSELRCYTGSHPQVLTIAQPLAANFSCLTSLHLEKVGISHLVLVGAPRLKNLTLENCPDLSAIIVHPLGSHGASSEPISDPVPALRRVRIMRCPKFAIYHWLYTVSQLYPRHDENLFITYRPFGQYNPSVESALWKNANFSHVMISHDYKQHESERIMEEFLSSFDQLFREVMNFSDMLIRRELVSQFPFPGSSDPAKHNFTRSEHGPGWHLVTDIPWVHEVCCSMLPNADANRSGQADQLYELLSEVQAAPPSTKLCRRGIHLHVQYRDVHGPLPDDFSHRQSAGQCGSLPTTFVLPDWPPLDTLNSYLHWPYTESYVTDVHPADDLNVWKDGCDERLLAALPPRMPFAFMRTQQLQNHRARCDGSVSTSLTPRQRLLLAQEEVSDTACDRLLGLTSAAQNHTKAGPIIEISDRQGSSQSTSAALNTGCKLSRHARLSVSHPREKLDESTIIPSNRKRTLHLRQDEGEPVKRRCTFTRASVTSKRPTGYSHSNSSTGGIPLNADGGTSSEVTLPKRVTSTTAGRKPN